MAKAVVFLGTAFFMAFIFWGSLTELSELTLAPGEEKAHTVNLSAAQP